MIIRKRDQDMSLNCFQRLFEKLKLFKDIKVFFKLLGMDRIKYNELVNFLIGNIFQDWDK